MIISAAIVLAWLTGLFLLVIASLVGIAIKDGVIAAETCTASHYGKGDGFAGKRTASGERMNPSAMTAAHRTLPFGTRVRVCHRGCVTVRINDRGPFKAGRCIDLSHGAARAIGAGGLARVTVARQ